MSTFFTQSRYPVQAYFRPTGLQEVEDPRFRDNRYMKVVRLSALRTNRLYSRGNIPGPYVEIFLGHMSMKISSDTVGTWTRDLTDCSAVPQPTACPRNIILSNNWDHPLLEPFRVEAVSVAHFRMTLEMPSFVPHAVPSIISALLPILCVSVSCDYTVDSNHLT